MFGSRVPDGIDVLIATYSSEVALARNVHRSHAMLLVMASCMAALEGACVVPADIRVPEDHAPSIDLNFTNPNPRELFDSDRTIATVSFFVAVTDPDDQTLHARAFIDGRVDQLITISNDRIPPPDAPGSPRGYFFDILGLCAEKVDDVTGIHVLELYVTDGDFVDTGPDLRVTTDGSLRDSVLWRFNCLEPGLQSNDGGI